MTIKLGTLAPQGSAWHDLLKDMAQRWEQASGGQVRLRIYAGGAQGSEGDMVRKMSIGQLQAAAISNVGMHDVMQKKSSILRNYPIAAHIRFLLEEIRPEIRQYFLESDTDGTPFNREKRSIVYQRAKGQLDKRPFGTQLNVYSPAFEYLHHSVVARHPSTEPFRVSIGGPDCKPGEADRSI